MDRESFIGLWDVFTGSTHSELLLQTDGTYGHSLWGGAQSHWGQWSLRNQDGHPLLVLELKGAQPTVFISPFGPVPMNWPKAESWVLSAVQPNQVNFYGGLMLRRAFAVPQGMPIVERQSPPAEIPKQVPATAAEIPKEMPAMTLPPPAYSAPPLPPPPDPHSAEVMKQWQSLNLEMYKAHRQANIDIYAARQEMDIIEFTARQKATFGMSDAVHENAQKFIKSIRG
jgi:hypothetical protein